MTTGCRPSLRAALAVGLLALGLSGCAAGPTGSSTDLRDPPDGLVADVAASPDGRDAGTVARDAPSAPEVAVDALVHDEAGPTDGATPPEDIAGACATDAECPSNSVCVTGICVCRAGHVPGSDGACVELACQPDGSEENDGPAEAAPLAEAVGLLLGLAADDPDWYSLRTCAGGNVTVHASFATGDIDLRLLADDGVTLLAAGTREGLDEALAWTSDIDRTVLVEATLVAGRCAIYSLGYTSACAECPADALEPNDGAAEAAPLDDAFGRPLTLGEGDEDWLETTLCLAQALTVAVTGDVALELWSDDGAMRLAASEATPEGTQLVWQSPADGRVLLRVLHDARSSCAPYALSVERTPCGVGCLPDALEENDGPESARPIVDAVEGNQAVDQTVSSDDPDWFRLEACAGRELIVRIDPLGAGGELLALRLLALDGTERASAVLEEGALRAVYLPTRAEPLLAEVTSSAVTCTDYGVRAFGAECLPCSDDGAEEDDDPASARPLPTTASRAHLCYGDDDWFVTTTCAGASLEAEATFSSDDGTVAFELLAADGATRVATAAPIPGGARLRADGLAAGTHHVRLRLLADRYAPGLAYRLAASTTCPPAEGE